MNKLVRVIRPLPSGEQERRMLPLKCDSSELYLIVFKKYK